ncbi:MAG TPA: hypothetical protein VGO16_16085 [Pseudonocardiaceae bacterium]|jgi:hypothetical protein|nr:hypothetical protein [Pseudonocardiaceae bacterium]
MPIFTAADGQVTAGRLATGQQAIFESLMNLEDHLRHKLLCEAHAHAAELDRADDAVDVVEADRLISRCVGVHAAADRDPT